MEAVETAKLMSAKRRLVEIKHVPASKDQPYQILRRRNGVFLYGCRTMLEVEAFLFKTSVDSLTGGVVRRKRSAR